MTRREEQFLREKFGDEASFREAAKRLEDGEPLAYILGEWYFRNETYLVTPDVLIPRSDTELLVDLLTKQLPRGGRFLDICTGSGCIAISTLCERVDLSAEAVDISTAALDVAKLNAKKCGVESRIGFAEADALSTDMFKSLPSGGQRFDAIVSNPPYIRTDVIDTLAPQVRREPRTALDGGTDGLLFYRALLRSCPPMIEDGGFLLFEIGYDQAEQVCALARDSGASDCRVYKDYGGNDRAVLIRF